MSGREEFDWEELLLQVAERRVIPIVGRELLRVDVDGESVLLDTYLSDQLAAGLGVEPQPTLQQTAFAYVQGGGKPLRIYSRLKSIWEKCDFAVPKPLGQLAEIEEFSTFVTTNFDDLLVRAIDEARFGGQRRTEAIGFSPFKQVSDLPAVSDVPIVFHLLGQISSLPEYAVTEEDVLEFVHALQSESKRPARLFDALEQNVLLILGCGFPDWLARFFVRTVHNERLQSGGALPKLVVDDVAQENASLVLFLDQYDSPVYAGGDVTSFVAELHERCGAGQKKPDEAKVEEVAPPRSQAPEGAIFISYSRDDHDAARALHRKLEENGLDAWLDERDIGTAVDWEREIERSLLRCSLFLPIVSRRAEARKEGYFRVEWKLAIKRSMRMAPTVRYIWPIAIDDVPAEAPDIPADFGKWNWARCPGGDAPQELIDEILAEIRRLRAPQFG